MAKKQKDSPAAPKPANLDDLRDAVSKKFGEGALIPLGESFKIQCETIPSGSLAIDMALGVGGYPKGRVVEIIGPEASGKTTLALHAVANAQRSGQAAAYIDVEHALDPVYMKKLGVDLDSLMISQPDNGEQALEIAELLIDSGKMSVIVIDSVAALVPKAELEGEMSDANMGMQARMMSKFCRKIAGKTKKANCTVIFINQIRHKIGVMFGNPETTPGGNALKFYASVRIDIRKNETITENKATIGHRAKIKIIKNKVATPFKTCIINMIYGKGIDYDADILDIGCLYKIIEKSGSWIIYGETRLGLGAQKAVEFLRANTNVRDEIVAKIRQHSSGGVEAVPETAEEPEEELENGDDQPEI